VPPFPGTTHQATHSVNAGWGGTGKKERSNTMLALKYLLMILGVGLFGSASALVVYDIFLSTQLRRLLRIKSGRRTSHEVHRGFARVLARATGSASQHP
jgi:hypothetical protein